MERIGKADKLMRLDLDKEASLELAVMQYGDDADFAIAIRQKIFDVDVAFAVTAWELEKLAEMCREAAAIMQGRTA